MIRANVNDCDNANGFGYKVNARTKSCHFTQSIVQYLSTSTDVLLDFGVNNFGQIQVNSRRQIVLFGTQPIFPRSFC